MVMETTRLTASAKRFTTRPVVRLSVVIASCIFLGCGGDGPTGPSEGALVTFRVVDETFRVHLLDRTQIDAARRAAVGGRARIPNGRVVSGTQVNVGWSWHLENVEFAELTTELCDGRPSDVEREGATFGGDGSARGPPVLSPSRRNEYGCCEVRAPRRSLGRELSGTADPGCV